MLFRSVSERDSVAGAGAGAGGEDAPRDKSGQSLLKDKTGLGLGWGRAPKDGRGPRVLRSVWRDWQEAEEFGTRWEVLSQEEVDRREIEKERASRSVTLFRFLYLSRSWCVFFMLMGILRWQTLAKGDLQVPELDARAKAVGGC